MDSHIKELKDIWQKFLLDEERHKSRATWFLPGDRNTKFFHHYTSHRKNSKVMWEILNENGCSHSNQEDLEAEAVKHFKALYAYLEQNIILEQVSTVQHYPSFLSESDVLDMKKPCTAEEIFLVLKSFARDKSPGTDGWTMEFFLRYFDVIKLDVLEAVEEFRRSGSMTKSLNSTFIVLIPKMEPTTLGDYRPISLCNLAYKIIA